ncbi:MAG: ABC transporter permease, partial [Coleofasciculaceae cyanobacterium]
MQLNLLEKVGDWNPQLLREIKGRLKTKNVVITVAISLLSQLLFFLYWLGRQPSEYYPIVEKYCKLRDTYLPYQAQRNNLQNQYHQLQEQFRLHSSPQGYNPGKVAQLKADINQIKEKIDIVSAKVQGYCPTDAINLQLWWQDHYPKIFAWFSVMVIFALLVAGTYMLINDLEKEERRGTLNFLKLSPQSTRSILTGKLLGVPILLYLAAALTIPAQIWLGLSAQISPLGLICFGSVIVTSCIFFYSAALLFGFIGSWLGGFAPWLGSGLVFVFSLIVNLGGTYNQPVDGLMLFSPSVVLPYLLDLPGSNYYGFPFSHHNILGWEWFLLPLGVKVTSVAIASLLNYGLWTAWIWQGLERRFRNPSTPVLSKRQSYLLTACFSVVTLGFAVQEPINGYSSFYQNLDILLVINLLLFLVLMAAISPQRQALQDWTRYRHTKLSTRKRFWLTSLLIDLFWDNKSPVLVAIATNLVIAFIPVVSWILFWPVGTKMTGENQIQALLGVILTLGAILICAMIAQLMLLMKTPKRAIWSAV